MMDAKKTLEQIGESKIPNLMSLVPKDQSPKLYLDLVKTQVMGVDNFGKQRPDEDMLLFLYVAKRTGLDPLTKQIYAIYRFNTKVGRETMTMQASIDGMRLVAQRTKGYAGQDDVVFDDETKKQPGKASVTVYKLMGGQRVSFTASARWSEYCQTNKAGMPTAMWAKMPYLMLGKCAEALALRKAFPNELSGIYAAEEMAQDTNVLGDLAAPSRFTKDVEVISGAPVEEATKSDLNIPEPEIKIPEPTETTKVVLGTSAKPDLSAMRNALKPEAVKKIDEQVKEVEAKEPIKDDATEIIT